MAAFSTVQLEEGKNHIKECLTKNNSRSLKVVTKSSSALNFGMFAHSMTLISRFAHIISKTGRFGQLR